MKTNNDLPETSRLPPKSMIIETNVPSIQAEHVKNDVAPVTAEYLPANASDEELG